MPKQHNKPKWIDHESESIERKQPTRMLKCKCEDCGYTIRATAKWLNAAIPNCPTCKSPLTRVG